MGTTRSAGGAIVYRPSHAGDAIDEYSRRITTAIAKADHNVTYVRGDLSDLRRSGLRPQWILLQYMPFSYGRRGIAPGLVRDAIALKRSSGATFGVMVHEAWVPMEGLRTCLMGTWQRAQLYALARLADVTVVSIEPFLKTFGERAVHVPVGSNVAVSDLTRSSARAQLGIGDELVVALFGTGNPHRALDHAEVALTALAERRGIDGLRVLNLGAGAKRLQNVPPQLRIDTPGKLPERDISRHLRASDLLLMPFTDGVSTRRTSLMAGLAHGLPVVGLAGSSTDTVLLSHPEALVLTPVGDRRAYARAVVTLAADTEGMHRAGAAAQALYAAQFDWPVVASRLIAILGHNADCLLPR